MTIKSKKGQSAQIGNPQYASVRRMAKIYDVSPATIWRWTAQGILPKPEKLSPGCSRWRLDLIQAAGGLNHG